jgi:hypothetical protein
MALFGGLDGLRKNDLYIIKLNEKEEKFEEQKVVVVKSQHSSGEKFNF